MNTLKMYKAIQLLKNHLQLVDESKYYNEDLIIAIEILENELAGKENSSLFTKIDKSTIEFINAIEEASTLELISSKFIKKITETINDISFLFDNNEIKKYNVENVIYGFDEYWYIERTNIKSDLKIQEYREYYLYLEMMKRTEVIGFGTGEAFLINCYHISYELAKEITTLWSQNRLEIVKELNKMGFLVYKEGLELH